MRYQLLISTMNQQDFNFVKKMNLNSDAIIVNQTDRYDFQSMEIDGCKYEMYSFAERGVGLSRNSAFMRADADIIEFADDDMIFEEKYKESVLDEFKNHPEADAILFSIESLNSARPFHHIGEYKRVGKIEARKYGCARLAVKREKMIYHNISFSLLFGGGAKYGAGEDTILINDLLNAGLKVYVSPIKVADVEQAKSSWYTGLNDKFYFDKGALMCATHPRICKGLALYMSAIHTKGNISKMKKMYKLYTAGINDYMHSK
ncbi:MAG: glycosyltransferase family A protein [Anaerostipes sp.]|nr:glycosyltransferase family A protein [Anaerostipes sp.]